LNGMLEADAEHLANLIETNTFITHLNVEGNSFGDANARIISAARKNHFLQTFVIGDSTQGDFPRMEEEIVKLIKESSTLYLLSLTRFLFNDRERFAKLFQAIQENSTMLSFILDGDGRTSKDMFLKEYNMPEKLAAEWTNNSLCLIRLRFKDTPEELSKLVDGNLQRAHFQVKVSICQLFLERCASSIANLPELIWAYCSDWFTVSWSDPPHSAFDYMRRSRS
jgi:hypothetical protein